MNATKYILRCDGQGIARRSFDGIGADGKADGTRWIETDVSGYTDENHCDECHCETDDAGEVTEYLCPSWTITCLDGGETYCEECMEAKGIEIEACPDSHGHK
jgi:hypothetical protein